MAFDEIFKNYLLSEGIDISNGNYKESEEYKKIRDGRIVGCAGGSMSNENYIESELLPQYGLKVYDVYKSKYDMGNKYEFDSDECEDIEVAKEIIALERLAEENEIEAEAEEFVKKFYRSGGLIERLKKYVDFDLDAFANKDEQYKRERCKILYFFYNLEKDQYHGINVIKLLGNPSMENIDNALIGMETRNGAIVREIKNSLEKELDLAVKAKIKDGVNEIVSFWDQALNNAGHLMDYFNMKGLEYDFEKTINYLLPDSKHSVSQSIPQYTLSPIETLYLKVLQHEYLGNVLDIDKVNNIDNEYNFNVPQNLIGEMKKLFSKPVDFKNIEQYIEDNARRLSKYVYLREDVSKEEVRKIKTFKKKVPKLVEYCYRATPLLNIRDISNELELVSMLQAIILDNQSEIFEYKYYGYQNSSTHKKQVQGALKNDDYVPQALQVYWVRKCVDHWYANLGRYDERIKIRKLEQACDSILIEILRKSNLDEMMETHNYYIGRLDDRLITTKWQIQNAQRFEEDLRDKGFEYEDPYRIIHYAFLYPPEIENIYSKLMGRIDNAIKEREPCSEVTLDTFSACGDEALRINFTFKFDYIGNKCTLDSVKIADCD